MKRTARGRLVPQSRSTDPRLGRVSLKAATLYDRMWLNTDDQGRLPGDPDEIKYSTCPNLPDISKADIPDLLKELEAQGLILLYSTSRHTAVQMLDWWQEQSLQWAYPSPYPAPPGWTDHLRYHASGTPPATITTINWPPEKLPSEVPTQVATLPPPTEKEKEKEEGRGNIATPVGTRVATPAPSPTGFSTDINKIINVLMESFRFEFGRVPADRPGEVIPREPTARERAQLRDLAQELIAGSGCPLNYIREAFREAAGQTEKSKKSVSYVAAILRKWLGRERARSP